MVDSFSHLFISVRFPFHVPMQKNRQKSHFFVRMMVKIFRMGQESVSKLILQKMNF